MPLWPENNPLEYLIWENRAGLLTPQSFSVEGKASLLPLKGTVCLSRYLGILEWEQGGLCCLEPTLSAQRLIIPNQAARSQRVHILSLDSFKKNCFPTLGWGGHILSPGLRVSLALTMEMSQLTCCIKSNCLNSGNSGNRCGLCPNLSLGFSPRNSQSRPMSLTDGKATQPRAGLSHRYRGYFQLPAPPPITHSSVPGYSGSRPFPTLEKKMFSALL